MSKNKREGLAARIIEDSLEINQGLSEAGLIPDDQNDKTDIKDTSKAFFMLEIEKKAKMIKELSEQQAELSARIEELEQENNDLHERIENLNTQINALQAENTELQNKLKSTRNITPPIVNVSELMKELKTASEVYARGVVTHSVSVRAYEAMRELMDYLDSNSRVKRVREGEFWNVAVWFFYEVFKHLRNEESFDEMINSIKNSAGSSAELLLQFGAMLLAYLNIDGWSEN